jgi:hypothetical protein
MEQTVIHQIGDELLWARLRCGGLANNAKSRDQTKTRAGCVSEFGRRML